jgi:multiple sugar transport system ATP-binding protein
MADITLNKLVKRYDNGYTAVKGIDLHINDKEFMVLVGPSGCGKSTSLRMIAGLEDISGGEIKIGERVVNNVEPKDRDIAMVFQNYALYPHMTVYENMAYALKLRRVARAEIDAKVGEAARMLALEAQLAKLPKELSGGQRQRVALGRAVVRHPQVFLFDEPLSNLDAKLRAEMRFELKSLQSRLKTTMVYVTHDQIEAMTLGDRITVMSVGEIQQVAAPTVIYDFPYNRFVAGFIGTPVMNFLDGKLQNPSAGGAPAATAPIDFAVPGGPTINLHMAHRDALPAAIGQDTVLGVRPENLSHGGYTPTAATATRIDATVVFTENMGDHHYVYLRIPGSAAPVVMKCNSHHKAAPGAIIPINLDTAHAHVFADRSDHGRTLTLPAGFQRQQ